jgi:hypothetical protein
MSTPINDQLVLIGGESGTGKSMSLMNLPNHDRVMYLNCEAGKRLPFKNRFKTAVISDPYQVLQAFDFANGNPDFDTIVVDTLTFLMDMFESLYVLNSANTMQAWGQYQQFFKTLMQEKVSISDKNVIFLAHTRADYDEKAMEMKTQVPIKGALKNNGIEAYFSTVVATKKISLKDLEPYREGNELLTISEQDELLGFKHVFQTQLTKQTIGERIRAPMGMFTRAQTFINNDAGMLLDHLHSYYA